MGDQAVNAASLSMPDRRALMRDALSKDKTTVISKSSNVDSSGPRTTMLRPGTILIAGASDGLFWDDETGGQASVGAAVSSLEAPSSTWRAATITLTIDGATGPVLTLANDTPSDTIGAVVTQLQAFEEFRALANASDAGSSDFLTVTLVDRSKHLKVTSSVAAIFGASGTSAFPTTANPVVTTEYCDQLDAMGSAANARVAAVKAGVFDESNLLIAGAAATSSALWPDYKRILAQRGSRFE